MGKSLIYILIVSVYILGLVSCNEINTSTPTNFTLADLRTFKQTLIQCQLDSECPFGSICGSSNVCTYGHFLCTDNDNTKCLYVNSEVYDPINDEILRIYKGQSNVISKPILKTCNEEQAEKEICSTDTCKNGTDCFSGKCKDDMCVDNVDTIYLCKGKIDNTDNVFRCGKHNQMKCVNDHDCYDLHCNSETGLCENADNTTLHNEYNLYKKWKIAGIILVIFCSIILGLYFFCCGCVCCCALFD